MSSPGVLVRKRKREKRARFPWSLMDLHNCWQHCDGHRRHQYSRDVVNQLSILLTSSAGGSCRPTKTGSGVSMEVQQRSTFVFALYFTTSTCMYTLGRRQRLVGHDLIEHLECRFPNLQISELDRSSNRVSSSRIYASLLLHEPCMQVLRALRHIS